MASAPSARGVGLGRARTGGVPLRDALRFAAAAQRKAQCAAPAGSMYFADRVPGGGCVLDRGAGVLQPEAQRPLAGSRNAGRRRRAVAGGIFLSAEIAAAASAARSAFGGRAARNGRILSYGNGT